MTRVYRVPGISCDHCKHAIEGEVGKLDDVDQVVVDIGHRTVTVVGDATDEHVRAAIDEAGYDVLSMHTA
jgi:copper chaperone CopZ